MNKLVKLPFISNLKENLECEQFFIQVILGPRQVGKTTTVHNFLKNEFNRKYAYYSADAVFTESSSWIESIWQQARKECDLIVIDEIQKIENWSEVIKKLWDEDRRANTQLKCALLGSSSLEIQKGLKESLAGRFQLIRAHHWNFSETHQLTGMSFEDYLKFGGYPASYNFVNNQMNFLNYLKQSLISTVIEKDILKNHHVKSPALFRQAFDIIMAYPAQEISYTKLLGQLQDKGNVEVIKYYLSLYEGAYLIKCLSKYSGKIIKRKASSPKLLPMCPAFYYQEILDDYSTEERGHAFELVVGICLSRIFDEIFYWREGNFEVDYVVKKGRKLFAIEVKSGRRKSEKGLNKFCQYYPETKKVFITPENYPQLESQEIAFFESI